MQGAVRNRLHTMQAKLTDPDDPVLGFAGAYVVVLLKPPILLHPSSVPPGSGATSINTCRLIKHM